MISLRKQKPGYAPQDVAAIIAQHNTQVSNWVYLYQENKENQCYHCHDLSGDAARPDQD